MTSGLEEFGIVDDDAPIAKSKELTGGKPVTTANKKMDLEQVKAALQEIPLFAGLLPTHLDRIGKLAGEFEYQKNEYVFHHGDEGDGLYLVISGAIRISRNMSGMGEEALAVLREGQHFGEMSLIDDDVPRSADALCHEGARLIKLPKHDLRDLMFVDRELAYELLWRFVRGLSSRLRDSNDRLMMLTATSKF
ncbi:cyclic nucleotide-binding domain protein [Plesiocystis pacifica SIR-1]|uniref:Cyclic nucleotide-binding domain protein n=1 Tax=Plesiocystis pacifica SIR-1 TaxID=391625 RepID=A6G6N1_9BACT|nr:cyclic nucleotide-binding domain-containing protein [Plesiocystis pacifica]EDM78508.1 cyclic nucleotide-binding domain protein [Plesiocystis pacifica SIR-1]